eukprot:825077-Pyramimonas_sp.AAC.1
MQVVLLAEEAVWAAEVEESFEKLAQVDDNAMRNYLALLTERVRKVVAMVRGDDLAPSERRKLMNVITKSTHARDV